MEQKDGFSYGELGVIVVYNVFRDYKTKKFSVAIELRDFQKRYCAMLNLSEEMFLDLLKQYTEFKEAGFTYDNRDNKFRKGKDER